jgi:hypothetical protein
MIAKELIANIRGRALGAGAGPRDLFNYLADQVYEARLADGQRLLDATDFKAWLRELAEASTLPQPGLPASQARRLHDTCPRCGHIHEGGFECGAEMGGGRICRCELGVPA